MSMNSHETIQPDEVGGLGDVLQPGDPLLQDNEDQSSRAEHLAWCKTRALAILDAGDVQQAFTSMASDLDKHSETRKHCGIELGMMLLMGGKLETPVEMRRFIEGFN